MPLPLLALAGVGAAIGGWLTARKVEDYLDPTDPGKFAGRAQANAKMFAEVGGGAGFHGIDQYIASRTIANIPADVRLDFIRGEYEPDQLRAALERMVQADIEDWRENPGELGYGDIFLAPFRGGSGISFSSFGMLLDSGKRALDAAASNMAGHGGTVGQHLAEGIGLEAGSLAHRIISGTADAAAFLAGDPLLVAGKSVKALRAAKLAGQGALDRAAIDWAFSRQRVQKWMGHAASELNSISDVHRWMMFGGSWINLTDEAGVDVARSIAAARTAGEVEEALRHGVAIGAMPHLPLFPRLGKSKETAWSMAHNMPLLRLGQRVWDAEVMVDKAEFFDDFRRHTDFLFGGQNLADVLEVAEIRKRLKLPKSMSDDAVRAHARTVMADKKASDWWFDKMAGAEKVDRVSLYEDMQKQGLRSWARREFGATDEAIETALANMEKRGRGIPDLKTRMFHNLEHGEHMARLESQLRYSLQTMSYDDYWWLAADLSGKRVSRMTKKAFIGFNDKLNRMLALPKRLWLANFRYAFRNSIDEMLSLMAHPAYGPMYRGELMEKMAGWTGRVPVAGAWVQARKAEKGLLRLRSRVPEVDAWLDEIGAEAMQLPGHMASNKVLRHYALSQGAIPTDVEKALRRDSMWAGLAFGPVRKMEAHYQVAAFHAINQQMLGDRVTKLMLQHWDDPSRNKIVRDWLRTDEGKDYLRRFADAWGKDIEQVIGFHDELIRKNIPTGLIADARAGRVPMDKIAKHMDEMPDVMWGPSQIDMATGKAAIKAQARLFKKHGGFFGWAGDVVDYVGRAPGYAAGVKAEVHRIRTIADNLGIAVSNDDILRNARKLTERQLIRHVDTPFNATRFDVIARGFLPFVDSQVRFWKRWGRLAVTNPGFIEKTRLLMMAGESVGWLEEDEHGQLVGRVPVVSQLFQAVADRWVGEDVSGDWFKFVFDKKRDEERGELNEAAQLIMPRGVPFWGDIMPGFSPLITFPVDYLTATRPGFQQVRDIVLGQGTFRAEKVDTSEDFVGNIIGHVQVGWLDKLFKAFSGAADRDAQYLGAWSDAMAYEAYKRSTDDKLWAPSDPADLQNFIDEAGSKAKFMWVMRGLTQAFVPWNSSKFPFGHALSERWHELRNELGPEEGFAKFMEEHGEGALPFTVAQSKHENGAAIAASDEAGNFYDSNPQFFRRFPKVAGFFTRGMEAEFDYDFYKRQLLRGERVVLPPHDWWADVMFIAGNREYYDNVVPEYEAYKAAGMDRAFLAEYISQQRQRVDLEYPGWAAGYAQWSSRQQQREAALNELRVAVDDELVADTEGAKALKEFISFYDAALTQAHAMGYRTLDSDAMEPMRRALAARAKQIMARTNSREFEAAYSYLWQRGLEESE